MGKGTPVEPGTPGWWARAAAAIDRAKNDRAGAPTLLVLVATTADLPPAADYTGGVAFHQALGVPVVSDGAHWCPVSGGAHL
jgi:hypothetical protein